jgi:cell division protein FtsI/penicillin-binding protein 2
VADLQAWQAARILAWARLLVGVTILLMLGVGARVVQLKIAPDPRLAGAVGSPLSGRGEPARRGDVLDRRGRVLATTSTGHRLFVDPREVDDVQTIAVDLARLTGGDVIEMDKAISARLHRRYVVVNELLEPWQVDAVRGSRLRGVGLEARPVRHYPGGAFAEALVGTVGFEHTGLSGMELRFDGRLRPRRGRLTYLRDVRRKALWVEPGDYRPGRDGADVRLSIDLVIQEMAEHRLARAVETFNAGGGRVVVLDCRTGEVLALHDVLNPREGWDEYSEDPARIEHPALGRNRCATDPYEPGSTFKPFAWAVATELGRAELDEVLDTPEHTGYRTSYGRLIRDSHYYGPSTWRKVLVKSMNSGMAIVADRLTHREMQDALARFGFGERTSARLPGESAGIMTSRADWSSYTQSSVAMGHEIGVTMLQMVRGFSAFARDGTMPALRLTAVGADEPAPQVLRRAISGEAAMTARRVMHDVMQEGTGARIRSELYSMFGKSGTAQLPRTDAPGYHEDRYFSSFVAGAPLDEPRLVVLCVIDDPERAKGHWGTDVAGPVVRDLIDGTLRYLGVAPDLDRPGTGMLARANAPAEE